MESRITSQVPSTTSERMEVLEQADLASSSFTLFDKKHPLFAPFCRSFSKSRIIFPMSDSSDDPGSNFAISEHEDTDSMGLGNDDVGRGWKE